jgi:hypothetical protein
MATLLVMILYCSSGLHAQNFTYTANTEYGAITANQYKVADGYGYGPTDPAITLTMDCLAANGYGQWTCSSSLGSLVEPTSNQWLFSPDQPSVNSGSWNPNNSAGWMLLGNLITKPSESYNNADLIHHPGCQPPGVVSGGTFNTTYPTTPKVTANLNGAVRYVWIEPSSRTTFLIEGLNDERGTHIGSMGDQQIDITLGGLPNPNVKPQIVKNSIYTYNGTIIYTNDGTNTHSVIPTANEADYRDQFDIACDQKYIYIVWCTMSNVLYPGTSEIWATALDITSGSVISGFPIRVSQGTGSTADNGVRPTVACDVRANPSSPTFDVAYISNSLTKLWCVHISELLFPIRRILHDPLTIRLLHRP